MTTLWLKAISDVKTRLFSREKNQSTRARGRTMTAGRREITDRPFVWLQFNFVGRILGPRGMTAKQLEQETGCKIMVRGKGSMRDKKKVRNLPGVSQPARLHTYAYASRLTVQHTCIYHSADVYRRPRGSRASSRNDVSPREEVCWKHPRY